MPSKNAIWTPTLGINLSRRLEITQRECAMKPRNPNTTRKPPVPSESHADIEDWIRRVMPDLHPIVNRLDELICEKASVRRQMEEGLLRVARTQVVRRGWSPTTSRNVVFSGGADSILSHLEPPNGHAT